MRRLLLVSSSRSHGTGYLEHCREAIAHHFAGVRSVLFVPFALRDHDRYEATVRTAFEPLAIEIVSLHRAPDPRAAVREARGLFLGGGNSFRLLKTLYDLELIHVLRERVRAGDLAYLGSSAGTNMACPTIRTTNDMPIVEPPSLAALGLIPFQINPHYVDPDPNSTFQGETREQRLQEYLEENSTPVLGLREPGWLEVHGGTIQLAGNASARLFQPGQLPSELPPGSDLSWLASA